MAVNPATTEAASRGIAADSAIEDCHGRATGEAIVKKAGTIIGRIVNDIATAHGHHAVFVVDSAAALAAGVAILTGQAENADGLGRKNVEYATGVISADAQHVGAGSGDCEILIHTQLAGGKDDRAGQSGTE